MADWVNKGSYQDVSSLLPHDPITALAPTSQEAGNQRHDNSQALTAPGSPGAVPVTVPKPGEDVTHAPPVLAASNSQVIQPGNDGKPPARGQSGAPSGGAAWGRTTVPGIIRRPHT